jgi:DNA-binding response OmpR family regulator
MKVLVVEHSPESKISLGAGLESLGYAVDVVTDGAEVITFTSCNNYDVIILDLMLPKESSLLALHKIRELDRNVDILILSTPEQIHDRVTALIQGADDYLVKPFSVDDLHASIQSLLRRKVNSEPGRDQVSVTADASTHLNRLIENLLKL